MDPAVAGVSLVVSSFKTSLAVNILLLELNGDAQLGHLE